MQRGKAREVLTERESPGVASGTRVCAGTGRTAGSDEGQALTVLVVEQDPAMRLFYAMALAGAPCHLAIHYAADGNRALALVNELRPGLVLCDLDSQETSGFLIAWARTHGYEAGAEVVAVTALCRAAIDAGDGPPAGVRLFRKPLSMRTLARIVLNASERGLPAGQ